jgi:hypothetical protein
MGLVDVEISITRIVLDVPLPNIDIEPANPSEDLGGCWHRHGDVGYFWR